MEKGLPLDPSFPSIFTGLANDKRLVDLQISPRVSGAGRWLRPAPPSVDSPERRVGRTAFSSFGAAACQQRRWQPPCPGGLRLLCPSTLLLDGCCGPPPAPCLSPSGPSQRCKSDRRGKATGTRSARRQVSGISSTKPLAVLVSTSALHPPDGPLSSFPSPLLLGLFPIPLALYPPSPSIFLQIPVVGNPRDAVPGAPRGGEGGETGRL